MTENTTSQALLIIDLDHFGQIHDAYGALHADAVLAVFSGRTTALLEQWHRDHPESSTSLAHVGGDEFVVRMHDLGEDPATVARELTELIIHRFAQPIAAGDEMILASASAGVAVTAGPTGLDDLLARAQRALDEAKRAGRNCARLVTI